MARYRVNSDFGIAQAGEVVDIDPVEWAAVIEMGMLSPIDDAGEGPEGAAG